MTTRRCRPALPLALALVFLRVALATAQDVAIEVDQTVGRSTDDVTAAGTQLRAFGEGPASLRFNVEGAWASRSSSTGDAFDTAYPYSDRLQVIEAYGERLFAPGRGVLAVRAGRFRTPFGIYASSDHAYLGFLRAPLIRYERYFALSNNYLEHGADVVMGTPALSVETTVGRPADVGTAPRRPGVDAVFRGEAALGPLIVGTSFIRTTPNFPPTFAFGHAVFNGVDLRWMHAGVQLRGEWIWGQPFDKTRTYGGYTDLIVHTPMMGAVTAVVRTERLVYEAVAPFAMTADRVTAGARVRLFDRLSVDVDGVGQSKTLSSKPWALDVGLTYSARHDTRR